MKRYRLIKEIKGIILLIVILFITFILTDIMKKIDDSFIESCTKAGYTIQHCERVK